ncbi:MAG: O-antigen ligase family protein [Anaerolineae bacterium]|nr:O-antigen ligase family protein [Anaerolineae bacterium]
MLGLGFALARLPLMIVLLLVAGSIGGLLLLLHPTWGLYLLAFAIPFGSLREIHIGTISVGASELLVAAMLAAWILRMLGRKCIVLWRSPLVAAFVVYIATQMLSLLRIESLGPALKELAKWIEMLALYAFVAGELSDRGRKGLVVALLTAGMLQAGLGIYQFLFQVGPPGFVLFDRYMRAYGTFLQPNPFAGYLGLLLPLAYVIAFQTLVALGRDTPGIRWGLALGAFGALSGAMMAMALVMSWSRGALLGLLGGIGLVALGWGRGAWALLGLGAALFALWGQDLLALLPTGFLGRLVDMVQYMGQDLTAIEVTDENFALIERAAHWQAAWRMFAARPWLGVGVGQYTSAYPAVAIPRWQDPLGHAHNFYLNVLAEGGLLGLLGYVTVQGAALTEAWRGARRLSGWERGLALATLGMLGHLLIHNLFDNLYVHEMYLIMAMLLGLTTSVLRFGRAQAQAAFSATAACDEGCAYSRMAL